MIGRLGMSISQMKMAYGGLRKQVFESVVAEKDGDPLFSSTKLEEWAKALVKEYTGDENSKMIPTEGHGNTNGKGCKMYVLPPRSPFSSSIRILFSLRILYELPNSPISVHYRGVTSMRSMNIGLPALFRSYRARANAETNCTIWEAIRATTASPLLFKSIKIGDIPIARPSYINAELGANNPVQYLMHEFRQVFAPPRGQMHRAPSAGCIVSLGTGKDGVISLRDYKLDDKEAKKKLYDTLLRVQKDCERAHQEFGDSNTKGGEKIYYRFNVEQGMQGIVDYDWEQDQHIMTQAQMYVTFFFVHFIVSLSSSSFSLQTWGRIVLTFS